MASGLTHITGTFLIDAHGSFLNGAGLGEGEDRNVSAVKTFRDGQFRVPYVSAQSWKRWLRLTLLEETGWKGSELRALQLSDKGTTNKIGGEFNPIEFPEDDIFGYMRTERGSGKIQKDEVEEIIAEEQESVNDSKELQKQPKGKKVKSLARASPFSASILRSLRKSGWQGRDEGFVHLKEGTPQPYTTEFYNTTLQGIFSLNYKRLGLFSNIGDRIEIDENLANRFLNENKIKAINADTTSGVIYEMIDADRIRKERTSSVIKALSVLRGGAKQAAFGTDVSPKLIILAGMSCGNPVFNTLFTQDDRGININTESLLEVISDYKDRFCTPVFVGVRNGYLVNENEIKNLKETQGDNDNSPGRIVVTTPVKAAEEILKFL